MHLVYTRFASLPSRMHVGLDTKLPIPARKSGVTRHQGTSHRLYGNLIANPLVQMPYVCLFRWFFTGLNGSLLPERPIADYS